MKRRSNASGWQIKGRRPKTPEPKRRDASKTVASSNSSGPCEETENARLARELKEALERQSASSQVLQVISSFSGELDPVFQTILANATRICEADFGVLVLYENAAFQVAATHNAPLAFVELRQRQPTIRASGALGRVVAGKQLVDISDCLEDASYKRGDADFVRFVDLCRVRSLILAPMLKENELIGVIGIYRTEVRPFTDKQIALVRNFAAQAVIAIENARLLNELRQSLEQQTATSNVLQVISSSPGDLEPVFATMLEKAVRICNARFGTLYLHEDSRLRLVAAHDVPPAFSEVRGRSPTQPAPGGVLDETMRTKQTVQIADLAATKPYIERHPRMIEAVELGGIRTVVAVPMLKDNALIGVIAIHRREVLPFTDKQIAVLTNFAAQAVIAIENARLLNELRQRTSDLTESLEQQTATSEVLQVISSFPGDLQPVFASMLENAVRICDATFGNIYRWDGGALHLVAARNTPPAFAAEARRRSQYRPDPKTVTGRMLATKAVVHIADLAAERAYIEERHPAFVAGVELGGVRTILAVPMLKDDKLIGSFTVYRQEVRPFTDKQIELVKNFASQAVIAIENARLLNELRGALERQTATSEVLQVISSSPGDLEPVFAAILNNAIRICEAKFGNLFRFDGSAYCLAAGAGTPPELAEFQRQHRSGPFQPDPGSQLDRVMRTKQVGHVADAALEASPGRWATLGGARTYVVVPMIKDDALIGVVVIYRQEVRPFTDRQIALVQNFANQAVIAIENARLLNELRQRTTDLTERTAELTEALEQQTATSDVLEVISSSPGDLEPVFATMLENAARICDAKFGNVYLWDGDVLRLVAAHNTPPAFAESRKRTPFRPNPSHPFSRLVVTKQVFHVPDVAALPAYKATRSANRRSC